MTLFTIRRAPRGTSAQNSEPDGSPFRKTLAFVWEALERHWRTLRHKRKGARPTSGRLYTGAVETRAGGREKDFPDAERLVKRLLDAGADLEFCAQC